MAESTMLFKPKQNEDLHSELNSLDEHTSNWEEFQTAWLRIKSSSSIWDRYFTMRLNLYSIPNCGKSFQIRSSLTSSPNSRSSSWFVPSPVAAGRSDGKWWPILANHFSVYTAKSTTGRASSQLSVKEKNLGGCGHSTWNPSIGLLCPIWISSHMMQFPFSQEPEAYSVFLLVAAAIDVHNAKLVVTTVVEESSPARTTTGGRIPWSFCLSQFSSSAIRWRESFGGFHLWMRLWASPSRT